MLSPPLIWVFTHTKLLFSAPETQAFHSLAWINCRCCVAVWMGKLRFSSLFFQNTVICYMTPNVQRQRLEMNCFVYCGGALL